MNNNDQDKKQQSKRKTWCNCKRHIIEHITDINIHITVYTVSIKSKIWDDITLKGWDATIPKRVAPPESK